LVPKLAFKEFYLYRTRFGKTLNDDMEKSTSEFDKNVDGAVHSWISGHSVKIDRWFQDFWHIAQKYLKFHNELICNLFKPKC